MWPGFKSRRRRHMWVEFVVGSLLCSERFFSGYSGFPSPQKPTFPNFNSTRIQVDEEPLCGCGTCKSLSLLFYYCILKNGQQIQHFSCAEQKLYRAVSCSLRRSSIYLYSDKNRSILECKSLKEFSSLEQYQYAEGFQKEVRCI